MSYNETVTKKAYATGGTSLPPAEPTVFERVNEFNMKLDDLLDTASKISSKLGCYPSSADKGDKTVVSSIPNRLSELATKLYELGILLESANNRL